ncbi:hypothetical protein HQ560_06735 [bacterium]|nr:hypothetical protein [bacterium]
MYRAISLLLLVGPLAAGEQPVSKLTEELEQKAFGYFWNESDPTTGLTRDRASNSKPDTRTVGSMAATGFALAAIPIGVDRGWITPKDGLKRAVATLSFARDKLEHKNGWYYHFVDIRTGERQWKCEVSSIDTALFLAGALAVAKYYPGRQAESLADEIYRRVDFPWMLTDGHNRPAELSLCHGWKPKGGFLPHRWRRYSEHMILYLLAMGSSNHPIPEAAWRAWGRRAEHYGAYRAFACAPLFTHQYSHAFVDFRNVVDGQGHDYWDNSVNATLADRKFCMDQAEEFPTYGEFVWGLSATDGPDGYKAYGAPPGRPVHDGTVAPWSMTASIVFAPELVQKSMQHIRDTHKDKVWGRYGFPAAFNVGREFWAKDVIGIDVGCALLMIENYRTGKPWERFMKLPPIHNAMTKAGFHSP